MCLRVKKKREQDKESVYVCQIALVDWGGNKNVEKTFGYNKKVLCEARR